MKYLFFAFGFFAFLSQARAQSYNPGLPLPGIPKSLGQKTTANSTSVTLASDQPAITISSNGKTPVFSIRRDYSTNNVTTTAYAQLVASTTSPVTAMELFDSSGQTLSIAFGGAGSEVNQFYDYPGGNGLIPVAIPVGTRVSITATSSAATSGELDINFYD